MSVCHMQVSVCKNVFFYGIIPLINPIYFHCHTKTHNSYEELQTVLFVSSCSAPTSGQNEHAVLSIACCAHVPRTVRWVV